MSKKIKIDPSNWPVDNDEQVIDRGVIRGHYSVKISNEFGRAAVRITCPFCGAKVTGYIWSLSGGGKRCDCGVIHVYGRTFAEKALFNQPYQPKK